MLNNRVDFKNDPFNGVLEKKNTRRCSVDMVVFKMLYCGWESYYESYCQWESDTCFACGYPECTIRIRMYETPDEQNYFNVCYSCISTLNWMEGIGAELFHHLRFTRGLPR